MPASTKTSAEKYGMNIRPLAPTTQTEFRRQARLRSMTQAQLLEALLGLAEDAREEADQAGSLGAIHHALLKKRGLERIVA